MKWLESLARIAGLVLAFLATLYIWRFGLYSPLVVRCGLVRGIPELVRQYKCYPPH